MEVNGLRVEARDGVAIEQEQLLRVTAIEDSEIVLVDVADLHPTGGQPGCHFQQRVQSIPFHKSLRSRSLCRYPTTER